jgi:transposase
MDMPSLFALPADWKILSYEESDQGVVVSVKATSPFSACPICHQVSSRIHSRYTRILSDLPCIEQCVCLMTQVRRFRCLNRECPRRIFTERIPSFIQPWARKTNRLQDSIQSVGLATTGEGGARLAKVLHIPVSPATILRRIMDLPIPPVESVTALGIDDFAFRRGQKYGTIFVDLERHAIIDILPERSVETSAQWMQSHPEIQFVSRDRGQEYTQATLQGAPQAVAIADRFHLLKNLIEAVEPVIARCCKELREHQPSPNPTIKIPKGKEWRQERSTYWKERTASTQENALQKYQLAQRMQAQGKNKKDIARLLNVTPRTVSRWIRTCQAPYSQERRRRQSVFDPYAPYVLRRWKEGCHNGRQLYEEIKNRGFRGTDRTVYRFLQTLRAQTNASFLSYVPHPIFQCTTRDVLWLMAHQDDRLTELQRQRRDKFRQDHPTLNVIYELLQWFKNMIRYRQREELNAWLQIAALSDIPELHRFTKGLERDKEAVQAAFEYSFSNGQVEGSVNKVKVFKRMMFGRASPHLLRQRVLYAR